MLTITPGEHLIIQMLNAIHMALLIPHTANEEDAQKLADKSIEQANIVQAVMYEVQQRSDQASQQPEPKRIVPITSEG